MKILSKILSIPAIGGHHLQPHMFVVNATKEESSVVGNERVLSGVKNESVTLKLYIMRFGKTWCH